MSGHPLPNFQPTQKSAESFGAVFVSSGEFSFNLFGLRVREPAGFNDCSCFIFPFVLLFSFQFSPSSCFLIFQIAWFSSVVSIYRLRPVGVRSAAVQLVLRLAARGDSRGSGAARHPALSGQDHRRKPDSEIGSAWFRAERLSDLI